MNVAKGVGGADDTAIPSAIRQLGKGQSAEVIAGLVERDLRERGLPLHVMCRWRREPREAGTQKGRLLLDDDGFPVLTGFTPFVPRKPRDSLESDGVTRRRYGARQLRSFGGEPIRTIDAAKQAISEMEEEAGVRSAFPPASGASGRDHFAPAPQLRLEVAAAVARGVPVEERTMGALTARMSAELPVCSTSVVVIWRLKRMQAGVFTPETRYDLLDRRGWQQLYEKTRTLGKLQRHGDAQPGLPVSLKTSAAYWDAVVRAMDFAVEEGSVEYNLARGVKRRRPRQQWVVRGRAKPLEVCQVRDLELVVMRIAAAARSAVAEGRVLQVRAPLRGLPRPTRFTQIVESVALTNSKEATVAFGVVAVGGVPIVQLGKANRRYFANGLEAMILTLYRSAPRASELLGLKRGSLDLDKGDIAWEWRRHWIDGHKELAGRRLALIEYGVKNSVEGDPVTRDQELSEAVVEAMRRWLCDLATLQKQGFKLAAGYDDIVFPTIGGRVLSQNGLERSLYAVQEVAGVPQSWPHRSRHALHALHAVLNIDIADTAQLLGQSVETAMRHYLLASGRGKRLAVERGEEVRRALDEGLSEDAIRARFASEYERGRAGSRREFGPQVIDGGLAS
jgi:hypothetical protein